MIWLCNFDVIYNFFTLQILNYRAKLYNKKRHAEKVQLKKTLRIHEEKNVKAKDTGKVPDSAIPAYLLDREQQARAKVLSNTIKQKRKEKAVCTYLY